MMLFSRPSKPPVANQAPAYGALRVNSSCYGGVIGVVLGTTRVSVNLIWSDDFTATAHTSGGGGGGGGGGKGGGGGGSGGGGSTTYTYSTAVAVAVSFGPVMGIGTVWEGKSTKDLVALGGSLMMGDRGQAPWGYLVSKHPDKALGYSELAYVGFDALDLGESSSMPNLNFEVFGAKDPANGPAGQDTHIAWCIRQALTAPWGAQFPASAIGDLSVFSTYCQAHGFFMSAGLNEARAANDLLNEWVTAAGAEFVWSDGLLKIVPYGEVEISGNGVTYTPDPTPVYDLGPADFVRSSPDDTSPLVKVARKKLADVYNRVKVEYLDRSNAYNIAVAVAEDPAHIATFGLREAPVVKAHQIHSAAVAQLAADLALARHIGVVTEYEFPLGWRHCRLEAMDLVTLSDPESDLDRELVRVTEIVEDDNGRLMVKAEEVPDGVAVPRARLSFQASESFALDVNRPAGPVVDALIFEPPPTLSQGGLEVWMLVCGDDDWGGCEIWISSDDVTYKRVGSTIGNATMGVLTAALPAGGDPDTVHTLNVDLSESRGRLEGGTRIDADQLHTLAVVGDELIAYQSATLTGSNRYGLSYLRRGAYNTAVASHPPGARFGRLDGNFYFSIPYTADQFGRAVYVKLVSFNAFGGGLEEISAVTARQYAIRGTALLSALPDLSGLATAYVAGVEQITWSAVSDYRAPIDYEIRMGPSWSTAQVIGRTPLTQCPSYGNGTYWIAAHYKVLNGGPDVYSANPVSVVIVSSALVANVIASLDEAASGWSGTLTSAMVASGEIRPAGAGDILACADFLSVPDLIMYGGPASTATYTVPVGHRIILAAPAACAVMMSAAARGQNLDENILAVADFLAAPDLLDALLGPKVSATPQIRLSQDNLAWGAWQDWAPGSYVAKAYDFRVVLTTSDSTVIPILSGFTASVDAPDRIESRTVSLASGAPTVVAYAGGAFNGSAAGVGVAPSPQVTILGAQAGDDVVIAAVTLSGFTASVVNAGAVVARSISYHSQGY